MARPTNPKMSEMCLWKGNLPEYLSRLKFSVIRSCDTHILIRRNPSSSSVQSQASVNCSPPVASPAAASVMSPHPSTPLPTPRQAVLPGTFSPAQQNPLAVTNPLNGPASVQPAVSLSNNKNPHVLVNMSMCQQNRTDLYFTGLHQR